MPHSRKRKTLFWGAKICACRILILILCIEGLTSWVPYTLKVTNSCLYGVYSLKREKLLAFIVGATPAQGLRFEGHSDVTGLALGRYILVKTETNAKYMTPKFMIEL